MALNKVEHHQLVFIAARLGLPEEACCERPDRKMVRAICGQCEAGRVSGVLFVHDHQHCDIDGHLCLIRQYRKRLQAGEEGFRHSSVSALSPHERDHLVFVAARRTHELGVCNLDYQGLIDCICHLCRQNHTAWLADVYDGGACFGNTGDREEHADQTPCWVFLARQWLEDSSRLERASEVA